MRDLEHRAQCALIEWAGYAAGAEPRLRMLFAIPNGGQRSKAVAGKLRAEGVKSGVPDLFLAVPVAPYHGLFIEMKVRKNKPTPEQTRWLVDLYGQGYAAIVAYGWEDAKREIEKYLRGEWIGLCIDIPRAGPVAISRPR